MSNYSPERLQRMLADVIANRFPIDDVELLLKAGADANGPVTRGLRPLHYAAFEDNVPCVRLLLEHGAQVDALDDVGYSALHVAVKHGHAAAAEALIDAGATVNFTVEGRPEGEPPGDDGRGTEGGGVLQADQPLNLAVENDQADCVELLLKRGADPNRLYFLGYEINLAPLEHVRCLELLLKYGADPNAVGRGGLTPLMKAAKHQMVGAVKVLLQFNVDVDAQCPPRFDRRRAIHFAAMVGNVEIVRLLLVAGASTGLPPDFKYPPLEYSITHDRLEVCQVLLEYGADPNEINEDGCSPLQVASSTALKNQKAIIECLLMSGALPNFCSERFSYIGPSLSALVEYLTYSEELDFTIVKTFLQFGSRVSFRSPTRLLKISHPCGILGQIRKLRPYDDLLCLLIDASSGFDAEAIARDTTLSNRQRNMLIEEALEPLSLKKLSRLAVREAMPRPAPEKYYQLPLPAYLMEYLLFHTI